MKRSLIPWRRRENAPALRREEDNPLLALHENMNRLFEDFFSDFEGAFRTPGAGLLSRRSFGDLPRLDIAENDRAVTVTADLPGLSEKDVEVSVDNDLLTIRGHREEEREDKKSNYHLMERSYGEFHRVIPVPAGVDAEKAKASFKNGVLTLTLPKRPEEQQNRKQIPISTG